MKYDIIIIGAGPGGIFSAYEFATKRPDLKVAVFETGNALENRKCPIDGDKVKSCVKCKTCAIMSGFGGAGAFSDGKYNITNDFGGTMHEYIGRNKALELMRYVDQINVENGGAETKLYSTAGTAFKKICAQNKLNQLKWQDIEPRIKRANHWLDAVFTHAGDFLHELRVFVFLLLFLREVVNLTFDKFKPFLIINFNLLACEDAKIVIKTAAFYKIKLVDICPVCQFNAVEFSTQNLVVNACKQPANWPQPTHFKLGITHCARKCF